MELKTSIGVNIQKIWGRNPKNIYGDNGNNNGTESVTVTYNGASVGTITIDSDYVTNDGGIQFTNAAGLNKNEKVTFIFTDY